MCCFITTGIIISHLFRKSPLNCKNFFTRFWKVELEFYFWQLVCLGKLIFFGSVEIWIQYQNWILSNLGLTWPFENIVLVTIFSFLFPSGWKRFSVMQSTRRLFQRTIILKQWGLSKRQFFSCTKCNSTFLHGLKICLLLEFAGVVLLCMKTLWWWGNFKCPMVIPGVVVIFLRIICTLVNIREVSDDEFLVPDDFK